MRMKNIRFFKNEIIILFLLIFIGCGKSNSNVTGSDSTAGSTGNTTSDSTGGNGTGTYAISFDSTGTPADNSVYLEKTASSNDEITLAVKVKGGVDVFGGALEITYDSSKIKYVSAARGSYLGSKADTNFSSVLNKNQEGVLLIGIDKIGIVPGANGDGTLVTIVLKALTVQTDTLISFNAANSGLKSTTGNITGTNWLGGKLSYQ